MALKLIAKLWAVATASGLSTATVDLSLFRHQAGPRRNPGVGYAWSQYALPDHADVVRAVRAEPGVALFLTRHPYRSRTTVEWHELDS